MICEYSHLDGPYVVGSLSPAERAEFEQHLAGCRECTRNVSELAGLPGLLSRVPLDMLTAQESRQDVPETLLPAVIASARRSRRRRAVRFVAGAAAAAVLLVAGTTAAVLATVDQDPAAVVETAPAVRMTSLGSGTASGWISLTEVAWGTRIDLTCTYGDGGYGAWTYEMVVRTRDGHAEQVGTWEAAAGLETHVTAPTSARLEDIRSVVVRTPDGEAVLRLTQ